MKEAAPMKTPRITDAQVDLLAERLRAVGVGRREFLKVAAGLAAMGPAGFNHRPADAAPKLAPGEKLAKDQSFRYGGGGGGGGGPPPPPLHKEPYCKRGAPPFSRGLKINTPPPPGLSISSKVTPHPDGPPWALTLPTDSKW